MTRPIFWFSLFFAGFLLYGNSQRVRGIHEECQDEYVSLPSIKIPKKVKWLFPYDWQWIKNDMVVKDTAFMRVVALICSIAAFLNALVEFFFQIPEKISGCIIFVIFFIAGGSELFFAIKIGLAFSRKFNAYYDMDIVSSIWIKLLTRYYLPCKVIGKLPDCPEGKYYYEVVVGKVFKRHHIAKSTTEFHEHKAFVHHTPKGKAPFWELTSMPIKLPNSLNF